MTPADRRTAPRPGRVLVVDDEPDIRELLEMTLVKMGLEVVLAGSVGEAGARLREGGLVATRREGTVIFYRLAHPAIAVLMHMLNAYFTQRNNRAQ